MFSEMAQKSDLSEGPTRQYRLVKHSRDTLDRYWLVTQCILHADHKTISTLSEWSKQLPSFLDMKQMLHRVKSVVAPVMVSANQQ